MSEKVAAIGSRGTPTVDELKTWIRMMGERGMYTPSTASYRVTALERLTSVLGPDDSRDPQWLLANVEELGRRWATKNHGKPETMSTYVSRVRGALEDFVLFRRDPARFKGRRRDTDAAAPREARSARARSEKHEEHKPEEPKVERQRDGSGDGLNFRTFPIGTEQFVYVLPPGGLSVRDVRRLAVHLLSFAKDFDPGSKASLFAITKSDE